jgi:hypothetical protein
MVWKKFNIAAFAIAVLLHAVGVISTFAQPSWQVGYPRVRQEVRSLGLSVRLNQQATVYYIIYRTSAAPNPACGSLTASQIKNPGTAPAGYSAAGSFSFGDASYCRLPPPLCGAVLGDLSERVFSVNLPINDTYRVFFTAESTSTPGPLTAPVCVDQAVFPTNRCLKVGSTSSIPDKFIGLSEINKCSPSQVVLTVQYTGVDWNFNGGAVAQANINFGDDGTAATTYNLIEQPAVGIGGIERNKAFKVWRIDINKTYDYAAGDNPALNPPGSGCTFRIDVDLGNGTLSCKQTQATDQSTTHTVWDIPNTPRGLMNIDPDGPDATNEEYEICAQDRTPINLFDASDFNCTTVEEARQAANLPASPNYEARWVQWVYGVVGSNVTTGPGATEKVRINGVDFNLADFPIYGPVQYQPSPATDPWSTAYPILMPTSATPGQRFVVEMRLWNTCNPYDNNVSNGGLNPVGGTFDVGPNLDNKWFSAAGVYNAPGAGTAFADGNAAPVILRKEIVIIAKPTPPVVANVDICSGQSRTFTVSPTTPGVTYRWYGSLANALAGTGVLATGSTFTPSNAQAPIGERRHFWVTATAANGCVSDPTEVTITRRPDLPQPPVISGPPNLCPSTSYIYTLPNPPAPVTIIDNITGNFQLNTEFIWTVPGAVGTITAGQGTQSLTLTSAAAAGSGNITVVNRYVSPPATTVDGSRCPGPNRSLTVNVRARPTVNITPNPANICEGSSITLNGNPTTSFGTISAHTWGGAAAILNNPSIQTPTVQASTPPGTYNLTYTATADFGGGVFCSSAVGNSVVNVSANPAPANAGPDQALCLPAPPLSTTLAGSNPAPGTGTWTRISGPGAAPTFSPNANTPNATVTVFANGIHTFRWTVVNGSCTSFDDVVIDFGTSPPVSNAGTDQDVCGLTTTLNGNDPTFATGTWSLTAGPGTANFVNPNNRNTSVTVSVPGTYTFRWRLTSGTCLPSDDFVDIIFRNPPTVSAPADFTHCLNNPPTAPFFVNLSGNFGGGASQARWEVVTGSGVFSSSGTATGNFSNVNPVNDVYQPSAADFTNGSVTLRLITNDPVGACTAVNDPVVITFDRLPSPAAAGPDFSTCDPNITLAATAANNGGTGTWTVGSALYYQTFTYPNSTGLSGPNPHDMVFNHADGWSITAPNANTLLAVDDYLRVQNNVMEARDVNDELVWRSPVINIAGQPNVTVSLQMAELGVMEGTDYIRAFYRLNGGPEVLIGEIVDDSPTDGAFFTFTVSGLSGTTLEIVVRVRNDANGEIHRFDNIFVSGSGTTLPLIADIHSPTSAVSNLPVGNTTFTWTVTSALGVCSSSNDQVVVTRHALPVNNNLTQEFCEDTPGGGTATVTLAFLTSLNDAITGIPSSTGRTVQFFTDPARTIAYPPSAALSDMDVVYTRVTRTDVTPGCTADGSITIRVNARPAAIAQNPEFCEDLPVGSNTRTGINLTTFNNAVKNNVPANTVSWFLDAATTTPVPDPTNVTANNGTSFYARVTDVKGCTNVAQVEITLNPRPGPNPIIGPSNVCADPTAINLYQVTTINAGATYTWNIPDPPFDLFAGGGTNDFFVLLAFPVIVNPGQDISYVETSSKGCQGLPNVLNITVEGSPPPINITGPSAVCENEAGVVYTVPNLANTTYSWTVPAGSAIISGQGTNQITVNFGTTPGLITVTPTTTTGCAGNPDDHSVAINPRPSLNPVSAAVCSDNISGITLSGTGAASFNITNVTVPPGLSPPSRPTVNGALSSEIFNDVFTNVTGGNLTVQYTVVPVSSFGCTGTAGLVNLTVRPEPTLASGLNDVICSGTEDVSIVLTVAPGSVVADQFEITSINTNGLTAVAGNPTTGIFSASVLLDDRWENLTGAPVTVEYFVRPINSVTGCIGDPPLPVRVTVNPEPVVNSPTSQTICSGTSPTITLTSTIPGSTFNWIVKSVSGLITGANNGSGSTINNVLINNGAAPGTVTYEVRATSPAALGSCVSDPVDVVITVNPAPTANNVSQTVCADNPGGNTFFINLTTLEPSVNNSGGVTFSWFEDLALTTPIATPTAYTLTNGVPVFVNVDNGQCTKVATVLFTIHPRPSVTTAITSNFNGFNVSCAGASDGQITATPADGVGPYQFSIDGGTTFFNSPVFNGLSAAGSPYVVRVRDANGCTNNSAPLTLTDPPALTGSAAVTSNYNGQHVSCNAASDGVIQVTPAGGAGGYTFKLLELPGNTTGNASGIYTGLRAGTYTFVIKDVNNCQFTTPSVTVTEPTPVTATAVLTSPVTCNGNSDGVITVTGGGGTLTGPNYQFTLNQPPGTVNNTGVFNGLAAGNYTVTVRDNNNCTQVSNTVTVVQPPVLTIFASVTSNYNGAKISCAGASDAQVTGVANGGNGGYAFELIQDPANLTGAVDGSFENLGPGNYSIRVTDAGGCQATSALVNVTEPAPVVASGLVSGAISCFGGNDGQITINGSGGTGAYTFEQISPAGPTNGSGIFSGLADGTYTFQVRDLNGCAGNVNVAITQPPQLVASASVTSNYNGAQISCNGASDGTITISASGGTGSLQYKFDQFEFTNTTGQFTGVFTGVPAGAGYTFTVRDSKNCTAVTAPINVSQPSPVAGTSTVTSNYNGQQLSCAGASDGIIQVTPSGGTGATYTFKLNQLPSNTTGDASGIYTGLPAGTYTVTIRDVNNCFAVTAPVTISAPPAVTASIAITSNYNGVPITCNGASDGVVTVTAGGGVAGYSFTLSTGAVASGNPSVNFSGLPAGNYSALVTDANGCVAGTTTVTINQPAPLVPSASIISNYNGEHVSCNGASDGIIRINQTGGTPGFTYQFVEIPANTTGQASGIFTGIPAGTYSFIVTDVNNCQATTAPITVTQPTPVVASATVTSNYNGAQISCQGANDAIITVTSSGGTGAATYVFDQFAVSNQTGRFSGVFTSVQPGVGYTFTVTDANGCAVVTAPVNVTEPAALTATGIATSNYNGFNVSCFNFTDGEITVTPAGGTGALTFTLLENPGNTSGQVSGIFTGLRAGNYRVRVSDVNGCLFTTTPIVVTQPTDLAISIAITSNYNGYHLSCFGASDGQITVTSTTGGAGGYSYELFQNSTATGNNSGQVSGVFTSLTSGLYDVNVTDANGCVKKSLPVVLVDPLPLFEGIIGFDQGICLNQDDPNPFIELAPAFGSIGNYAYQWQESTDGINFTNIAGATSATYDPPASLTTKTFFRRVITSGCETLISNVVSVTVRSIPVATITPSQSPVCEGDFFILNFTFSNGQAPYFFDYNDGTTFVNDRIGADNTPVPILNYTDTKTYTLTELRDFNGCYATVLPPPVTVPVIKINPNFTVLSPPAQCSGSDFTFQWTVDPDTEYTWIWSDGQQDVIAPNSLPSGTQTITHNFVSFNTSTNTNFPVILSAVNTVNNCGPKQTTQTVTLYPNILINMFPNKTEMCSDDAVTIVNPTLGGSSHVWQVIRTSDNAVIETRSFVAASNQTFTIANTGPNNPDVYNIVYTVNNANCSATQTIPVTVYRRITASFDEGTVPPFVGGLATVTYTNTSNPIDPANFSYDWEFGLAATPNTASGIGPFTVNYTSPGVKTVRLTATNTVAQANGVTCVSVYEENISILMPPLVAAFTFEPANACFPTRIRITSNTSTGDEFEWRVVDQSGRTVGTANIPLPEFDIVNPGTYTIFLTTRNTITGQVAFADNSGTGPNALPGVVPVNVYSLPLASFQARPTTLFVPDTELVTFNFSTPTNPPADSVNYWWNFGDTNDIIKQNHGDPDPTYRYAVEGLYTITMVMRERRGNVVCTDTVTQQVIAREGGLVKIPNAFTPDPSGPNGGVPSSGAAINDVFLPLVKGINVNEPGTFLMQIFDRWGNLIFESRNEPGAPVPIRGWDGYDRNNRLLPAGVYVYRLVLRLSDGQQITKIGDVTLIR